MKKSNQQRLQDIVTALNIPFDPQKGVYIEPGQRKAQCWILYAGGKTHSLPGTRSCDTVAQAIKAAERHIKKAAKS